MMKRRFLLLILFSNFIWLVCNAQYSFTVYNDGLTYVKVDSGLTVTILGNFVSQTVDSSGRINNKGVIKIAGDWYNNNTDGNVFSSDSGKVVYSGTSNQHIRGNTSTSFHDLEIDNSGSEGVYVHKTINVTDSLILTDGNIYTDSSNLLVMKSDAVSNQGSASSFVDGPMQKEGSSAFVFPLGDDLIWARLAIGTPTASTTFQAEYFNSRFHNFTNMYNGSSPVLNNVSKLEFWQLTRASGSGDASLEIYWEDATVSDIDDCNDLRIAFYNGISWQNDHESTTSTTGSCAPGTAGTVATSDNISSFGYFTFGSKSDLVNPLPIELLSFTAECEGNKILLKWITASEINNDFFTIEKSTDLNEWTILGFMKGAGNSNKLLYYSFSDVPGNSEIMYYRLRQTDFDGKFNYSGVIQAKNCMDNGFGVSIFPNPTHDIINIYCKNNQDQILSIDLFNSMGTRIYYADHFVPEIDLSNWEDGIFFLNIRTNNYNTVTKIIIKN